MEGSHPEPHLSAGKPALREAFVLGAVTGAGVVGLLSLCLIVFM